MEPSDSARMVFSLAYRYYRLLPSQAKGFLDLDDFAAVAIVRIEQRKRYYDPKRSAYQTWAYHVARSTFQDIIQEFNRKCRQAEPCDIDKLPPSVLSYTMDGEDSFRERRVERFLRLASDEMRDTIREYFFGGRLWRRRPGNEALLRKLQDEAQILRRITAVSVADFLYVRGSC